MYAVPVYTLRLFNVDDVLTASITNSSFTNSQFLSANFNVDTGFFDLSSLVRPGTNTINLSLYNDHGGWTYGYDFKKDGQGVFVHAITFSPDAVGGSAPEPASILLTGMGFVGLAAFLKRKTRPVV